MTSVVVFDLGGVLCRFDPSARLRAFAAVSGWTVDAVHERIWGAGRDVATDTGALSDDEVFELASLGGRLDHAAVLDCWAAGFTPDDEVLDVVDRVTARRALLTNNGPVVEEMMHGVLAPVADRCDPVLLSYHLGAVKPSRSIFDRAAEQCSAAPDELLLVDDSPSNVDGARAAGWDAIRFDGVPELTTELTARGLTAG